MPYSARENIAALTPVTFEDLFTRRSTESSLTPLFEPKGPLFVCAVDGGDFSACQNVWLIDGDDTLWEDNVHYEALASELASHVVACVGRECISEKEVRVLLDAVEHEIIPVHGFGPLGFDLSVRECFVRLKGRFGERLSEPGELFERIVPLLSGVPYNVDATLPETLRQLRSRGDGVVLFTQGPCEIQQGKIARSGLAASFHALAVGSNKKPETYSDLLTRLGVQIEQAVVVGNSLRSEVEPALAIGARAVHYLNPNSWHVVNKANVPKTAYREIHALAELLS